MLSLEQCLHSGKSESRRAHEPTHKLGILIARERTKHCHQSKLLIELIDVECRGAQSLDLAQGLHDTTRDRGKRLISVLHNVEEVVIGCELHSRDLLSMHSAECSPHGGRVVLLAFDMSLLGGREMSKDLASSLLLVSLKAIKGLSVLHLDLGVHGELGGTEVLPGAVRLQRILDEGLLSRGERCIDVADNAKLAKASSHVSFPSREVELSEVRDILGGSHDDR